MKNTVQSSTKQKIYLVISSGKFLAAFSEKRNAEQFAQKYMEDNKRDVYISEPVPFNP